MKALFDQISTTTSKNITRAYSTSFSLGILFLEKRFRTPIYSIYGFVRIADEIVDTFHDYPKEDLIARFREDTIIAIEQKISLNPILNAFQQVVHDYNIEWELIDKFLISMEMDLDDQVYSRDKYEDYIFGSAEAVGLMCLRVFAEGNTEQYDNLVPAARKLGAAFQKVNFLRDLRADFEGLERSYFPGIDLNHFTQKDKELIQAEIAEDFRLALEGIRSLPKSSRRGVYLAYVYYQRLFKKICKTQPEEVMETRIRIPNATKMSLMFQSLLRHQMNLL
ncbi:MAG TPA: phytoene synthase [Flavobacteriales bacterium]|jgi:phytoene synthase|nr:phytoene synthase [Flavobacteriales bacterium]